MFLRRATAVLVVIPAFARAEVVSYEGEVFPEKLQWERLVFLPPGRSLDDGWFVQFFDLPGERAFYRRSLADFAGETAFFVEWRVQFDAPSSILDFSGIPVVLSLGGPNAANYHTTITDERVQLFRSTFIPLVFVDIDGDTPHTYHLELRGAHFYAWYIDGQLIDSGVPEGPYPNIGSILIWGARHYDPGHTTRWDYIRYGTIPADGSGDFDTSGNVDARDFYFFHECFSNSGPGIDAGPGCRFADFDGDDDVDLKDLGVFQNGFTSDD